MGFISTFSKLASALGNIVKNETHLRSLQKADVQQLIRNNIEDHNQLVYALTPGEDREYKAYFQDVIKPTMKKSPARCKGVYDTYLRELSGKALDLERKRPLGSLIDANQKYIKILEAISKQIDVLFEQEAIDIYNTRMSQLAVLGLLRRSDKLVNFTSYLFAYFTRLRSRSATGIPKYRDLYLVENVESVAQTVTELCGKTGTFDFLNEVRRMRESNADLVLGMNGKFDFTSFANMHRYNVSFIDNLLSALSCLNIFSYALDAWDDYKLAKYERNKETREWLANHVALLRLDLNDADKTSPEYTRLVSVVEAYDNKIAEYDRDILAFEQEKE